LADVTDLHHRGRKVFCSRYCQLHAEADERHRAQARGPRLHRTRRALRWGFAFLALLIAALVAVLFITSSGSTPVAVGEQSTLGNWSVGVDAGSFDVGPTETPGGQKLAAVVTLRYRGPGQGYAPFTVYTEGSHGAKYPLTSCYLPLTLKELKGNGPKILTGLTDLSSQYQPSFEHKRPSLFSGASERVAACFDVAPNDVSTLVLYVKPTGKAKPVAFSLHPQ
jgi:hypothetical protein